MAIAQSQPETLWIKGRIGLRLGNQSPRWFDQPFVRVGGNAGADLRLTGREIHAQHAYLHLDHRGLFALDLTGRAGLRIDGLATPAGWLVPGRILEVAGQRIEVVGIELDGAPPPHENPGPIPLLTETAVASLIRVELDPFPAAECPWVLDSELVVLGRAPACGIPISDQSAAWVHAVIIRAAEAAYIVNLTGSGLACNGGPVREAATLRDGDVLSFGSSRLGIRMMKPSASSPSELAFITPSLPPTEPVAWPPIPPADLIPAASQSQILAWMMGALQTLQTEMLRRQDAFQRELVQALHELHRDQQDSLEAYQTRVEAIQQELVALREDILRALGPTTATTGARAAHPPRQPLLRLDTPPPPADPEDAASWLLERMQRLDTANHASWRDLLSNLASRPRS